MLKRPEGRRPLIFGLLQPAGPLEACVKHNRDKEHQHEHELEAIRGVYPPRFFEVHPEDTRNERRDNQDSAPGGDLLHLIVLPDANHGQIYIKNARQHVAVALDLLCDPQHTVPQATQPFTHLRVYQGMVANVSLQQLIERSGQRLGRLMKPHNFTREFVYAT